MIKKIHKEKRKEKKKNTESPINKSTKIPKFF